MFTKQPGMIELSREKVALVGKLEVLLSKAENEKRSNTAEETQALNDGLSRLSIINGQIEENKANNSLREQFAGKTPMFGGGAPSNRATAQSSGGLSNLAPKSATFIRTGELCDEMTPSQSAALTEGGGAAGVVPAFELQQILTVAPALTPFEQLKATIYTDSDFGFTVRKVPFVLANDTLPSSFAEAAGPSSVQDATVASIEIPGTKYAFLTKMSEELDSDVPDLGQAIMFEGIKRIYRKTVATATTALISSLITANAVVSGDTMLDPLEMLLNLETAVDPSFSGPGNGFMLSRASLTRIRNLRDQNDRPIFDLVNRTIIGYPYALNDGLTTNVVFGNWGFGAYLSYSSMLLLRLVEAYRESGMIGIRFARRFGAKFFSDASNGGVQPLYLGSLEDFAS
jgi:HK97 family phage major capsid protein